MTSLLKLKAGSHTQYSLVFKINDTRFSASDGDKDFLETYRKNLLDALKKAYEGPPFVFDNMGYAAGEIKSYLVSTVEEK